MPEDDERKVECQKCTADKCYECSGSKNSNKCKSCISSYKPIYEGNEIIKCACEVGEKEKCKICEPIKNECIVCNEGHKLLNGECISYSIKAIYNVTSKSRSTKLISSYFKYYIKYMIIDGIEIKPCDEYHFYELGIHKVYFFLIYKRKRI